VLARAEHRPLDRAAHADLAGQPGLHLDGEDGLAARHRGDRVAELVDAGALEQAPGRAGADRLVGVRRVDARRQQQDAGREGVALDDVEHVEAVECRHENVDDRDVRERAADLLQGLAAVGRLADELEVRPALDGVDDRLAIERVILDHEHPYAGGGRAHVSALDAAIAVNVKRV